MTLTAEQKKEAIAAGCLKFDPHELGGEHLIFKFKNGFGASVVCNRFSYGGEKGLFELAVLGPNGHLNYETPITDDVIGWLTWEEVLKACEEIAALPA